MCVISWVAESSWEMVGEGVFLVRVISSVWVSSCVGVTVGSTEREKETESSGVPDIVLENVLVNEPQ